MTALQPHKPQEPALFDPQELVDGLTHLTALMSAWRGTPPGQTLADSLTPEQQRTALSTLDSLALPAEPREALVIVKRMLALYPVPREGMADSVPEDWARVLMGQPLASIWACYESAIRRRGRYAPSLGDFFQDVQSHASLTYAVKRSVQGKRG